MPESFLLLGVIHGHWDQHRVATTNMGIAIVVPGSHLAELLDTPEVRALCEFRSASGPSCSRGSGG